MSIPQKLENGAKVLAFVPFLHADMHGHALCLWGREFVTWQVSFSHGEWFAEIGHYYGSREPAMADFLRRIKNPALEERHPA